MSQIFTGFDSAWGGTNPGAICDLEATANPNVLEIRHVHDRVSWAQVDALLVRETETHVLAIDQGLVVPNTTGQRPVERDLARALMGGFRLGAHSSNTSNPCYGPTAGIWDLTEALDRAGYVQDPMEVARQKPGRWYFECYPHPAWIGLLDLPSALLYKVKKRNAAGWQAAVTGLRSLSSATPSIANVAAFVPTAFAQSKPNEDALDAIISAYVAALWWHAGTQRSVCLGDLKSGYIVTPFSRSMKVEFDRISGLQQNADGRATSKRPVAAAFTTPSAATTTTAVTITPTTAATLDCDSGPMTILTCNDTTNLWENHNPWMTPRSTRDLLVTFCLEDGLPTIRFVPFGGNGGPGMKVCDADCAEWLLLAQGASNKTLISYDAVYRYV